MDANPVGLAQLPKCAQRVLIIVVLALALGMVMCTYGLAAPRVQNAEDCDFAALAALVSRALAVEGVDQIRASRIVRIVVRSETDDGAKLLGLIIDHAYAVDWTPIEYANRLAGMCVARRGNMDEILGTDL